ncbi:apolipoprotein N-acyltransferase [Actibacterium pelagium]|uniref:Apolipoprotein N-acyltransferase n=1 Tax=Actibacterium pelagium TaxID=2029103 RepID=A0A917ACB1_9RHOB|nr:apolipoprotein N-acyltransferase [Actibacterium pelagium]GGE39780.1 apolipoprotein N-acyltransferase [Actibacterium pelagium]
MPQTAEASRLRRTLTSAPALALVCGALVSFGQAPFGLWPVTVLALAGMFHLIASAPNLRRAIGLGWWAGLGYIAATHHWIVMPFFVDAARHGWMAPFALFAMSAGIALFWAAAAALGFVAGQDRTARLWALAIALPLTDLGRAYVFTGFPWAPLGAIWLDTPVAQGAALVGPYGLALVTCLIPAALLTLHRHLVVSGLALVPALALAGFGLLRETQPAPDTDLTFRVVQPNAAQHLKWDPDYVRDFFDLQLTLTEAPVEGPSPDLIIWPETAVAYGLGDKAPAMKMMAAASNDTPVMFGVQRRKGERLYNSLAVIGAGGQVTATYDKARLVPFGEYTPYGAVLDDLLGIGNFAAEAGNGYSHGPRGQVLDLGPLGVARPLICYEAIFPQDAGSNNGRPSWIANLTNDAWFGDSVMPRQHLAQTRLRAIEQGLPAVRAANTGISAMIDAHGNVRERLDLKTRGYFDATLPGALPETIYAKTGNLPGILLLFALYGVLLYRARLYPH